MESARESKQFTAKKTRAHHTRGSGTIASMEKICIESSSRLLFETDLSKFCPKKLFYICFVNESATNSIQLLNDIVEISKHYEEVSSLTFITRGDVLSLLDTSKNIIFPNQLKPLLLNVIESANLFSSDTIPILIESQLLKLKLIQVMYEQYVDEVKINQKQKNLEDLLSTLTKECRKKQNKGKDEKSKEGPADKNKSPIRDDGKKKNKKDTVKEQDEEDIDYTLIPLDNDGISYDENIFNRIWFYALKGFYHTELLQNLIEHLNVPICSIIKIMGIEPTGLNYSLDNNLFLAYWKNIETCFFERTSCFSYLEDTMIMNFALSKSYNKDNLLQIFEEFLLTVRTVINVKLNHLNYIRHLRVNTIKNKYALMPIDCLRKYNWALESIPLECISSALILDAIMKEVSFKLDADITDINHDLGNKSIILSRSSSRSFNSVHCIDPLHNFDAFLDKKMVSSENFKDNSKCKSFLAHENNILTIQMKFHKQIGPTILKTTIDYLKKIPLLQKFLQIVNVCEDVLHKHDIEPSTKVHIKNQDILDHFMYLFLFTTFENASSSPKNPKEYDLIKNLITYNKADYWKKVQVKCNSPNLDYVDNLYDTPSINFIWKEKLNKEVLLQELSHAFSEFSHIESNYSPETDTLLIMLSNKLDEFGINTNIYETIVRTPTCLRDFSRYTTIEESDWLIRNKLNVIEDNLLNKELPSDEVCAGAKKIKTQLKIFDEYAYLLDENVKDDDVLDYVNEESKAPVTNFNEIYSDLQKYPSKKNLLEECENASETNQILSYDLGTNLCKITGSETIFHSHDGARVVIDNTRFLQSPEKCTIKIISEGDTLVLHSNQILTTEPFTINLILENKTRIVFLINREEQGFLVRKSSDTQNSAAHNREEVDEQLVKNIEYDTQLEVKENETINNKQLVHCVDEEYFQTIVETGEDIEDLLASENSDDIIESLMNAKYQNGVLYKISTKSYYLKRLKQDVKVPLAHALKNILPKKNITNQKNFATNTKRYESTDDDKLDLEIMDPLDFRICLPNGLFIRAHPSVISKSPLIIKQEYAYEKPQVTTVQHEEFRLFSSQGYILIKKVDGTITILKANGDIIDFEKPTDESSEESTVKPCHCTTLEDYRNMLSKMLKTDENCEYFISRRGHLNTKQSYIVDEKIIKVLKEFNVPYIRKTITRFDGKRIKINGDKISQKQLYHTTSQQDFFAEEIYFERSDDFKSIFDRNGAQKVLFPDGTVIFNALDIADEFEEDFVYVTLSFQYEHPNYASVKYGFDNTVEIILNDGVVLAKRENQESFTVKMKKDVSLDVSKEEVMFKKTCEDCLGSFSCNFNIKPFYESVWAPTEEFLHAQDSYNKHLYCDFVGNCSRNSEYLNGALNSFKCNHFRNRVYKQMFVVNKDLSGEMFLTNQMVEHKVTEMELLTDASVRTYNMLGSNNIQVIDCRKNNYASYCNRFFNNSIWDIFDHSNKKTANKNILYTTFRVFHKMLSIDDIQEAISNLQKTFFSEYFNLGTNDVIFKNIADLVSDAEQCEEMKKNGKQDLNEEKRGSTKSAKIGKHIQDINEGKRGSTRSTKMDKHITGSVNTKNDSDVKCTCVQVRQTMDEKMANWRKEILKLKKLIRNKTVPGYFTSDFCRVNE